MALTTEELIRLALDLRCDPRTLRKELAQPGSVRGQVGERIRAHVEASKTKTKKAKK